MQTLIDVTLEALPPEAALLLDPDRPLGENVILLPLKLHSRWLAGAGAVLLWPLVWLFGQSWGLAVVHWLQGQPTDPSALVLGPCVTPAVLGGALYLTWSVWRSFPERRLLAAGRWRQGFFLTETFLLLREEHRCWLIERSNVEAVRDVYDRTTRRPRLIGLRVVYRDDNSRSQDFLFYSNNSSQLRHCAGILNWWSTRP